MLTWDAHSYPIYSPFLPFYDDFKSLIDDIMSRVYLNDAYCFANCNMPISTTFIHNESEDYSSLQRVLPIIMFRRPWAVGYLHLFILEWHNQLVFIRYKFMYVYFDLLAALQLCDVHQGQGRSSQESDKRYQRWQEVKKSRTENVCRRFEWEGAIFTSMDLTTNAQSTTPLWRQIGCCFTGSETKIADGDALWMPP